MSKSVEEKMISNNNESNITNKTKQMTTTAEAVREAGLDKFYTIPAISEKCLDCIGSRYNWSDWGLVIEPSAGNGSFLTRIPVDNKIGIDTIVYAKVQGNTVELSLNGYSYPAYILNDIQYH